MFCAVPGYGLNCKGWGWHAESVKRELRCKHVVSGDMSERGGFKRERGISANGVIIAGGVACVAQAGLQARTVLSFERER